MANPSNQTFWIENIDDPVTGIRNFEGSINGENVFVLGYYTPNDGGGGEFYWDDNDNTSLDNNGTIFISNNTSQGRWKRIFSGAVNVGWFGAIKSGDVLAEIENATDFITVNGNDLYFPTGTYEISSELNFIRSGVTTPDSKISIICAEGVIFEHTGSGTAVSFNITGGFRCCWCKLIGKPLIKGNASTLIGFETQNMVQSVFEVRVTDVSDTAFNIGGSILSQYDLTCSSNVTPFSGPGTTPNTGIKIGHSDIDYTACCDFRCIIEGVKDYGIDIVYATGCRFTGTAEGLITGLGVRDTTDCIKNMYDNFWLEKNEQDMVLSGPGSLLLNLFSNSSIGVNPNIDITADTINTTIIGGFLRWTNLNASSKRTSFLGTAVSYSPFSTIGILGAGHKRLLNVSQVDGSFSYIGAYNVLLDSIAPGTEVKAMGNIGSGTTFGQSYNIASVSNPAVGQYIINFVDPLDQTPVAVVTPFNNTVPVGASTYVLSNSSIEVQLFSEIPMNPIDTMFSLVVY